MEMGGRRLFVCNCEGTMPLEGKALARACGAEEAPHVHGILCRAEIGNVADAAKLGTPMLIACTQEAPVFAETIAEASGDGDADVLFVNIRERAGWSREAERALPKIAALLEEAAVEVKGPGTVTLASEGRVLVYGKDEAALEVARQLAPRLAPTVVLRDPGADLMPPLRTDFLIFGGRVKGALGHLGAFKVVFDRYAAAAPSARASLAFGARRDGIEAEFDLILDLSGEAPLFPSPDKRDGYFRPDPGNPALVQKALFDLTDLVGEFEKPIYVRFEEGLCAHSRSRITGCTRCLDVCPAGAIRPAGDVVEIDPHLCGGCGSCASVCPTGASTYALPATDTVYARLRTLLRAYKTAGGAEPVLLLHDQRFGDDMIAAMARLGDGLPANVLPFALNEVTQVGLDFLALAFAYGVAGVMLLVNPARRHEIGGLAGQVGMAEAALAGLGYGSGRIGILDDADPNAVAERLWAFETRPGAEQASLLAVGGKRTVTMLGLRHLHAVAPQPVAQVPLPPGAPFGTVLVDAAGCTLCLACVGACPTGAMIDNPDRPMLRFNEEACIQCGLCRNTCPESVIRLEARLDFTQAARTPRVLKEEEPFECIRCGKPFGTKASIEKVVERLSGHAMFAGGAAALDRIRMCDDCRVIAEFEAQDTRAFGARKAPRTTEDYLKARASGRPLDDDEEPKAS